MILTTDVTKGCGEIQRNAGRESVSAVEIRLTEPDHYKTSFGKSIGNILRYTFFTAN